MPPSQHTAETLLEQAHPPETASVLFKEKVLHKPLRLRPTSPEPNSQDARARRRQRRIREEEKHKKRRKPKPLSAREKRISGVYDVTKDPLNYEVYVPLHNMWQGYMQEILGLDGNRNIQITPMAVGSKLTSADYHGSRLKVVRSRCAGMVGLEGIVIRDTKYTFQFVTRRNELKIIPKRWTIFEFQIERPSIPDEEDGSKASKHQQNPIDSSPFVFELHGSQFEQRPPDRATKKFKQRVLTDI